MMNNYTLFIVVFLLIYIFIIYLNSSEDLSDVVFNLSETGQVKVINDQMSIRASIESELRDNPDQSLKQITDIVQNINATYETNNQVRNLKIHTSTRPEYDYQKDGGKTLKGYIAKSLVSFDVSIRNKEQTLQASEILNRLSSMSSDKVKVLIEATEYSVSSDYLEELRGRALENAIQNGKDKAKILVNNTYPRRELKIINISVRDSSQYGSEFAQSRSLEIASNKNIVAHGESSINVTIDMKVGVI